MAAMIDNIRTAATAPAYPTEKPASRTPAAPEVTGHVDTSIPATPPAELLHELDNAQQVVADLQSRNLEIRFAIDDGHVRTQLLDHDGKVVQELPARHALDILAGRSHLVDRKA
jgi:hypothetical protein